MKINKMGKSICLILLLTLLPLSGCIQSSDSESEDAIDFSFTTLDGEEQSLSDYRGKVVILDFMAVNCQPCIYEMYELYEIYTTYSRDEVDIISIDVWVPGETIQDVRDLLTAFREQADLDLEWTFGVDDASGTLEQEYASTGVPSLYIIDQKGNIYYSHVGYESYSAIAEKIDELLM